VLSALTNTYLLASVGVGLEVAFTALTDFRTTGRRLTGQSYLWMFPIYATAYPLLAVSWPHLQDVPIVVRGVVYVLALFVVEYASGWLIRRLVGECPWESGYFDARWGIHGLVRLDYAPAWFVVALFFERLYLYLV
jgi:hypothetical protein